MKSFFNRLMRVSGLRPVKKGSSLQLFPKLLNGQVALSRAELMTGIVLDENCVRASTEKQKIYTVFSDIGAALSTAKEIIAQDNNVECVIYKKMDKVVYYLNSSNIAEN